MALRWLGYLCKIYEVNRQSQLSLIVYQLDNITSHVKYCHDFQWLLLYVPTSNTSEIIHSCQKHIWYAYESIFPETVYMYGLFVMTNAIQWRVVCWTAIYSSILQKWWLTKKSWSSSQQYVRDYDQHSRKYCDRSSEKGSITHK